MREPLSSRRTRRASPLLAARSGHAHQQAGLAPLAGAANRRVGQGVTGALSARAAAGDYSQPVTPTLRASEPAAGAETASDVRRKLGIAVSATSVRNILAKARPPPAPQRDRPS